MTELNINLTKKMSLDEINKEWVDMPEFYGNYMNQINKIWISEPYKRYKPKYPVYIISKGRAYNPMTARFFEKIKIPYKIVIEPQEFEEYNKKIPKSKILVLPFSNLGKGSIPARNWVWEHSISIGAKRHWIFDDNIDGFVRKYNGLRRACLSNAIFEASENFINRYKNIGMAGFNYTGFAPPEIKKPFYINTRIYSMINIDNSLPFRWRGKYNEDTDLSLRVLKKGYCTVLFNNFLGNKMTTMTMPGGNEEIYKNKQRDEKFCASLKKQHSDVVKCGLRWGRVHHYVDYTGFTQRLIRKKNIKIKNHINNYNMILVNRKYKEEFISPF